MLVRDTLANLLENGFDTVERLRCIEASTSAVPRAHRDRGHPQRAWATRPSRECDGRCVPPFGLGHPQPGHRPADWRATRGRRNKQRENIMKPGVTEVFSDTFGLVRRQPFGC